MLDHMVNNCLFSCHGNMSQLLLQLVAAVHLCMALPILYSPQAFCLMFFNENMSRTILGI